MNYVRKSVKEKKIQHLSCLASLKYSNKEDGKKEFKKLVETIIRFEKDKNLLFL